MTFESVAVKYGEITAGLIGSGRSITTMESCTSGLIASLITDTEGASAIFRGAFVTYSNEEKIRRGVPEEIIQKYGVYSKETAREMAAKSREAFRADIGVGITGCFGNADPENEDGIPGEIYYAVITGDTEVCRHESLPAQPSRFAYKLYAADKVADLLLAVMEA